MAIENFEGSLEFQKGLKAISDLIASNKEFKDMLLNQNSNTKSNKELSIKIIVASELSDEQLKGIIKKFKDMYKVETVQYTIEIDESIIGGIKVCVGNKIYDNTIDTRLRKIFNLA